LKPAITPKPQKTEAPIQQRSQEAARK
jgi:hypothetical protein